MSDGEKFQSSSGAEDTEWLYGDYSPGISKETWMNLIKDPKIFYENSRIVMSRFLDFGGEATCKQLSEKYGESYQYYLTNSVNLAKRVKNATDCPMPPSKGPGWWAILYTGRGTDYREDGTFIWRLRDELREALIDSGFPKEEHLFKTLDSEEVSVPGEKYGKKDFLQEVYITEKEYERLKSLLENKKNIILHGPPGVGKTYMAKRLIYSIMGEKDDNRIESIQFHQNYSYEDMVIGYRPTDSGFKLTDGVLYRFCDIAREDPGNKYFFIIDEINRGNLSKIFGELFTFIEKGYRGEEVKLAYGDKTFSFPENVYIIGMMNTADRSIAMMDYALRRRFGFFEIGPKFDSEGFTEYQKGLGSKRFDSIVDTVKELNAEITGDNSLGKGYCIGHSFLCGFDAEDADERCLEAVEYEIMPLLEEYWFDDDERKVRWTKTLRGKLND